MDILTRKKKSSEQSLNQHHEELNRGIELFPVVQTHYRKKKNEQKRKTIKVCVTFDDNAFFVMHLRGRKTIIVTEKYVSCSSEVS